MSLKYRSTSSLQRDPPFRDAKLFVVATEGTHTEPQYFGMFHSTRIKLELLPTENGASSPEAVLQRLKEYISEYQIKEDDQLFVVIDTTKS
jgi:RloB-like protein